MKQQAVKSEFERTAVRVSTWSIIGNAVLTAFKLFAGVAAHSEAMISDAVHSASDVLSSVIVIIGVKISTREADQEHPYGHERMECVAAIILSVVLALTGAVIGRNALQAILSPAEGGAVIPGVLALAAACVSIVMKEIMYRFTMYYARKLDSASLRASAWDHRSDALSSIGALVGIAGARMGYPVLENIASLIICVFILKAAVDIFRDAVDKMVDHSCDADLEQQMTDCACQQEGVLGVDLIQTREFGSRIYVDIEIRADPALTLAESHSIAEKVHDAIENRFEKVKHIMVHVNPAEK